MIPFPPAITLDLRAMPLKEALPLVGRAFGTPMRAAPAIGGEIVILSLREAELPILRERLAAAFAGEWSVDPDGTLVFGVDAKARQRQARDDEAARRRSLAASLAESIEEAMVGPEFTRERARATRETLRVLADGGSPEEPSGGRMLGSTEARALARVLMKLDARDLPIASGTRIVFSSRPTPRQRAFPFDPAPILAVWGREETVWRESDREGAERTPASPATITLSASVHEEGLLLEMSGYDARGDATLYAQETLDLDRGRDYLGTYDLAAIQIVPLARHRLAIEFPRAGRGHAKIGYGVPTFGTPSRERYSPETLPEPHRSLLRAAVAKAVARMLREKEDRERRPDRNTPPPPSP